MTPPIPSLLFVFFLFLLHATTNASHTPSPNTTATFLLHDNGSSLPGIPITLSLSEFPTNSQHPMEDFAIAMSHRIHVSKFGEEPGTVVATKAFRGDGERIERFHQLLPLPNPRNNHPDDVMRRVYLVADGLEFIWPFIKYGHNQTVSRRALVPLDPSHPVILSSISETPRVFLVYNLFSPAEAETLVEHNLKGLHRSTTGSGVRRSDPGRTSENSWDSTSPVAKDMITRTFNLTGIEEDVGKVDGLQVVRYLEKQFYNTHHDYFQEKSDGDWDFMPYSGGSNRFATVFMYVSDVLEGGHTVFPQAPNHQPPSDPNPPAHALELFSPSSMEHRMVRDCHTKTSVPPARGTAALFYSATPDGRMDPASLHGACPVIRGVKWGANIWIWNRQRFGLIKTGDPRGLQIRNECKKTVFVEWEGKPNGHVEAGGSYKINSFEFHRFKASFEKGGRAFAEFTVQGKEENVVWVIKEPRVLKKMGVGKEMVDSGQVPWSEATKGMIEEEEEETKDDVDDSVLRVERKRDLRRKKRRRKEERRARRAARDQGGERLRRRAHREDHGDRYYGHHQEKEGDDDEEL